MSASIGGREASRDERHSGTAARSQWSCSARRAQRLDWTGLARGRSSQRRHRPLTPPHIPSHPIGHASPCLCSVVEHRGQQHSQPPQRMSVDAHAFE